MHRGGRVLLPADCQDCQIQNRGFRAPEPPPRWLVLVTTFVQPWRQPLPNSTECRTFALANPPEANAARRVGAGAPPADDHRYLLRTKKHSQIRLKRTLSKTFRNRSGTFRNGVEISCKVVGSLRFQAAAQTQELKKLRRLHTVRHCHQSLRGHDDFHNSL